MGKKSLNNPRIWDFIANNARNSIEAGGWYSSFDGKPFSEDEMQQYVDNTLSKLVPILSEEMIVAEIGCASGLTMFPVSKYVKRYIGTDMASINLKKNMQVIESSGIDNIELIQCTADQVQKAVKCNVDMIIINSVCQYFNGMDYLREVIRQCIELIKDRGYLYIGDVLDKDLLELFIKELKTYKELHPSEHGIRIDRSDELWIEREFFCNIKNEFPCILDVVISDKLFHIPNELTKYRYDVLIRIER